MKSDKQFSLTTYWMSNLGATGSRWRTPFNIATYLYCVFFVFFILACQPHFAHPWQSIVSLVLFSLSLGSLLLLPLFPLDTCYTVHRKLSDILLSSIICWLLFIFFTFPSSPLPFFIFKMMLVITLIFGVVFGLSLIQLLKKYGHIPIQFDIDQRRRCSFFMQHCCPMEWIITILVTIDLLYVLLYL